jgi:hypothetical protein
MAPGEVEAIARITAREHLLIAASRGGGGTMDASADKAAALIEVSRILAAAGARHALIGGVAVGVRSGVPRATLGTEFAVHSATDRTAVIRALTEAGCVLKGQFAHSVNFRHRSGEPVQIVLDPQFDPMIDRAEAITVGGTPVPVVTKADLITMKERAAADPARRRSKALRDAADVALLRDDVPDPDEGW